MNQVIRSARICAGIGGAPRRDTSAPSASAASQVALRDWRVAVKRNTAGALRITDMPCGTSGWSTA